MQDHPGFSIFEMQSGRRCVFNLLEGMAVFVNEAGVSEVGWEPGRPPEDLPMSSLGAPVRLALGDRPLAEEPLVAVKWSASEPEFVRPSLPPWVVLDLKKPDRYVCALTFEGDRVLVDRKEDRVTRIAPVGRQRFSGGVLGTELVFGTPLHLWAGSRRRREVRVLPALRAGWLTDQRPEFAAMQRAFHG